MINIFNKRKAISFKEIYPPEFFKKIILFSALVAIGQGTFPVSSDEAKDKVEKVIYVGHDYYGKLSPDRVKSLVKNTDSLDMAKTEIAQMLNKDPKSLGYYGANLPKNLFSSKLILRQNKEGDTINNLQVLKKVKSPIYLFLHD
jgi:hypothetical protein